MVNKCSPCINQQSYSSEYKKCQLINVKEVRELENYQFAIAITNTEIIDSGKCL